MAHEVVWTQNVVRFFEEAACLNEIEKQVLETRVHGMTIKQQALYLCMSESSVSMIIRRLKFKYDAVQREYPGDLKPRRKSIYEEYMDSN